MPLAKSSQMSDESQCPDTDANVGEGQFPKKMQWRAISKENAVIPKNKINHRVREGKNEEEEGGKAVKLVY